MFLYYIKEDYIDFLKTFEPKIAYNKHETRPYIGVVISVDDIDFFAPLSSPKQKHLKMKNDIDFRKIDGGRLGVINLNNMIPVSSNDLIPINFDLISDVKYKRLLQNQYRAICQEEQKIITSASKLRAIILADESKLTLHEITIKKRCCNIKLLEKIYSQIH